MTRWIKKPPAPEPRVVTIMIPVLVGRGCPERGCDFEIFTNARCSTQQAKACVRQHWREKHGQGGSP